MHSPHKRKCYTLKINQISFNKQIVTFRIRAIDCDPDWSENQQFAVLTSNNLLHVWDLNKKEPVYGHRALEKPASSQSLAGAMCYLKTKRIMSVDSDRCVIYCASSNTFSLFTGGALLKNNTVTLLKACPYDSNLVAAGTKNGLILISKVSGKHFYPNPKLKKFNILLTCPIRYRPVHFAQVTRS